MTGVHYVDVNGRSVPIAGRKRIGDHVGMPGRQHHDVCLTLNLTTSPIFGRSPFPPPSLRSARLT